MLSCIQSHTTIYFSIIIKNENTKEKKKMSPGKTQDEEMERKNSHLGLCSVWDILEEGISW